MLRIQEPIQTWKWPIGFALLDHETTRGWAAGDAGYLPSFAVWFAKSARPQAIKTFECMAQWFWYIWNKSIQMVCMSQLTCTIPESNHRAGEVPGSQSSRLVSRSSIANGSISMWCLEEICEFAGPRALVESDSSPLWCDPRLRANLLRNMLSKFFNCSYVKLPILLSNNFSNCSRLLQSNVLANVFPFHILTNWFYDLKWPQSYY